MFVFGLILCATVQVSCFARAGGGGSGGGGSGGGGGSHSSSHTGRSSGRSNPISALVNNGIIVFMICGGSIAFAWKVRKASKASKKQIRAFEKTDSNWDYKEMQDYVIARKTAATILEIDLEAEARKRQEQEKDTKRDTGR